MKKNTHREPTLYIVGNKEKKDEIKHVIEGEWGGINNNNYLYEYDKLAYFINTSGRVNCTSLKADYFKKAVANGRMKEFQLPDRPLFKPFDKVVARSSKNNIWFADFYCRYLKYGHQLIGYEKIVSYCLPYNERTAKLIGTSDEWKGGSDE